MPQKSGLLQRWVLCEFFSACYFTPTLNMHFYLGQAFNLGVGVIALTLCEVSFATILTSLSQPELDFNPNFYLPLWNLVSWNLSCILLTLETQRRRFAAVQSSTQGSRSRTLGIFKIDKSEGEKGREAIASFWEWHLGSSSHFWRLNDAMFPIR